MADEHVSRRPRIIYEITGDYRQRDSAAEWLAPKSDYYAAHNNDRSHAFHYPSRVVIDELISRQSIALDIIISTPLYDPL